MHLSPLTLLTSTLALAGSTVAAPHNTRRSFGVPTDDGFPNPNQQQLLDIERIAQGKLANAPPPATIGNGTRLAFKVIAFNEQFEVAFYNSLINNITSYTRGYTLPDRGEEEGARGDPAGHHGRRRSCTPSRRATRWPTSTTSCRTRASTSSRRPTCATPSSLRAPSPPSCWAPCRTCSRSCPRTATTGPCAPSAPSSATRPARTASSTPCSRASPRPSPSSPPPSPPTPGPSCRPSPCPTRAPSRSPTSPCPSSSPSPCSPGNGGTEVESKDQSITFSVDFSGLVGSPAKYVGGNGQGLFITYLNGQQQPISEPVQNIKWKGQVATFDALFPYSANVMDGLSIAALTTSNNFTSPDAIPDATIAAPGAVLAYPPVTAWDGQKL